MNRTLPRKRALVKAGNEAADRLIAMLGHCEWCKRTYGGLCQHEIARGASRLTARIEPAASIVLCAECHADLHEMPKRTQVLIGLAILYSSRGSDYSLARFHEIECPHAPNRYTQRDVDRWLQRLTPEVPHDPNNTRTVDRRAEDSE